MLNNEEIQRRKPLWQAFSNFWLDNQLQDYDFKHTVKLMISSDYSFDEIEKIFSEEVAPVVYVNLFSVAGQWGFFNPDWLYGEILKNLKKQERNPIYRAWIKSGAGKFVMTKMVREDWKKVAELYFKSKA